MSEPLHAATAISDATWRALVDSATDVGLSARQLPAGPFEDLARAVAAQLRPWYADLATAATKLRLSALPADAVGRAMADQLIGLIVHATGRAGQWVPDAELDDVDIAGQDWINQLDHPENQGGDPT